MFASVVNTGSSVTGGIHWVAVFCRKSLLEDGKEKVSVALEIPFPSPFKLNWKELDIPLTCNVWDGRETAGGVDRAIYCIQLL